MVYIANLFYLMSYLSRDITILRVYTISAALCLITYFYSLPEPLWTVVFWNIFFVMLNIWQIARQQLLKPKPTRPQNQTKVLTTDSSWSPPKGSCCP